MGNVRVKPEKLPQKLKSIRVRLNLTAEELIEKLNCPKIPLYRATISKYESGRREPPLIVLLRYAKLADISTDILIDDNEELSCEITKDS